MRLKELVPRQLALGQHVWWNARATRMVVDSAVAGKVHAANLSLRQGAKYDFPGLPKGHARDLVAADHYVPGTYTHQPHCTRTDPALYTPLLDKGRDLVQQHMTRWVVTWPAAGYGVCVGLTFWQQGIVHASRGHGEDYDEGYLDVFKTWPVYMVRTHLRSRIMYVPPQHCIPMEHGGMQLVNAGAGRVPYVKGVSQSDVRLDTYIERWLEA